MTKLQAVHGRDHMINKIVLGVFLLVLVSAITYLPLVRQFGYTHDDWYLMASARSEGSGIFREIFSADRPMRALVMIPAYELFGINPLYYNLSAYIFRVLGALALFWVLNMLWPGEKLSNKLIATLFVIYPGFLSQPNGIDYQSHILGLALALLSVALTIQGILAKGYVTKITSHFLAVLVSVFYLGQMEWYIGFEFFRWASVFLLSAREGGNLTQKISRTIRNAYTSLLGPSLFLIWRIFFFHSVRRATDVDTQFSQIWRYPLQTIYHWSLQVAQDFFDVTLSAWVIPLSQLKGYVQTWSIYLTLIAVGITLIAFIKLRDDPSRIESASYNFQHEALLLGLCIIIGGLLPIAMVNRDVSFPVYSRYSLVSSVGVAILIPSLFTLINWIPVRNSMITILYLISILTHHANAVKYARETAATNTFWHQVAWRAPQLAPNTTLIAKYPSIVLEEDYFIWGPANLIYYPQNQSNNENFFQPYLYASLLNNDTVTKVLAEEKQEQDKRRGIIIYPNPRQILVLSQPTPASCVHIINGIQPEYSSREFDAIRLIGSHSDIEKVLTNETSHTPLEIVFGPEPPHGWCYYFQKADLARQQKDWDQVVAIGEKISASGFSPTDLIEWMPFIQAYAQTGHTNQLIELASIVNKDPNVTQQACQILNSLPGLAADIQSTVNNQYCIR